MLLVSVRGSLGEQPVAKGDTFVDGVFAAAGLPLLHIPVRRAYLAAEIEAQIAPFLGTQMSARCRVGLANAARRMSSRTSDSSVRRLR